METVQKATSNLLSKPRAQWADSRHFVFACMAYAIGVGSLWRFPYLCYKNGGVAFFIPYLIVLLFAGLPLWLIEVGIGQHHQTGGISVWRDINPLFKGIGWGASIIAFLVNCYYIVILSWTLLYLLYSIFAASPLPWTSCDNWWNSANCWSPLNESQKTALPEQVSAAEEFWNLRILQRTDGITEAGGIQPELSLTLLVAWILCFLFLVKGIRLTGRIATWLALTPYFLIIGIFLRSLFLHGAWTGILHYLTPDFGKLLEFSAWTDAASQVFFSFGLALGVMTALGSYNNRENNFYHQMFWLSAIHTGTAFLFGLVVFTILGFWAHHQDLSIDQISSITGSGLAFITYPQALALMPWPSVWCILFFSTLFLLGLGSQAITVQGFLTAMVDACPFVARRRKSFLAGICVVSYLIGLAMITRGGTYVFRLFDNYAASGLVIFYISFLTSLVIGWIYKADHFAENIEEQTGIKVSVFYLICWKYVTPLICGLLLLWSCGYMARLGMADYPWWSLLIGWFMLLAPILAFPIGFVLNYFTKIAHVEFTDKP